MIDTKVTGRDIKKEGPICTGPYAVKSYSKAKAVMVANEKYWNGKVPFKNAEISTIDDPNTRAMALQKVKSTLLPTLQQVTCSCSKTKLNITFPKLLPCVPYWLKSI